MGEEVGVLMTATSPVISTVNTMINNVIMGLVNTCWYQKVGYIMYIMLNLYIYIHIYINIYIYIYLSLSLSPMVYNPSYTMFYGGFPQ